MSLGDSFIRNFNELDHLLREKTGLYRNESFPAVIECAAKKDATVRRYREFLLSMGQLRNAIVHDRDYPDRILADPRADVVEELQSAVKAISSPPKLIPKFQKDIRVFFDADPLADCLSLMKDEDLSQVVVNRQDKHVLLSSEGIVKWLENARDDGIVDLEGAFVGDALEFEPPDMCRYLARNDSVDEALEMFEKAIASNIPRLQAILITENGKSRERPIGIVTPWDLLNSVS